MTGLADNYAVVGQPIAHSLSPDIHAAFAEQTGQRDVRYGRLELRPEEFAAACRRFFQRGGQGLNVTAPHKAAALTLCDQVSDAAQIAGAVNTISLTCAGRLRGDNTDGDGLLRDLKANIGLRIEGQRIVVIGAGGASRGVIKPLLDERPASLTIANRTRDKAVAAARVFSRFGPVRGCGLDQLGDTVCDLIIDATTAGIDGEPPAIGKRIVSNAVCYDMTYASNGTAFTAWASAHGARSVHTGIGMLLEQAALSFQIWRGVLPATAPVRAMLARERGLTF